MPQTTLQGVKLPGYAQLLNLTISSQLEFLADNRCVARWSISPESDQTLAEPKVIDSGTSIIDQAPQFVLDAHQAFFDAAMPTLLLDCLRKLEGATIPAPDTEVTAIPEPTPDAEETP
jgi:hypothetical protein